MSVKLKPLHEQVLLITGASSGIGSVTAKHAAAAGAKVILVARNEEVLNQVAADIKAAGGDAVVAVADVADKDALAFAAERGVQAYGRIDTWVNNAGTGQFANIADDNTEDDKRLFETNFWGVVHGSRIAVQYLRDGGALINVGSEVSDVTTPTQGMYSASKHAVLGFTDAFRMEVIKSDLPISVTLIKPAGIDTPFPTHAKNNTDKEGTLPAPVYAPELVADQILHAAEHPVRDLYVGGGGRLMVLLAEHFPTLSDWVIAKFMPKQEQKDQAPDRSNENLHGVGGGHADHGSIEAEGRQVRHTSLYGVVSRHPYLTTFGVAAASAAAAYLLLKPETPEPVVPTNVSKLKKTAKTYAKKAAKDYAGPISKIKSALSDYADNAQDYATDALSKAKKAAAGYADTAQGYASDARDTARGYAADGLDRAHDAVGDASDAVSDHVSRARSAAKSYAGTSADSVQDALQEHLVAPAEKLIASVKKKIDALLKA